MAIDEIMALLAVLQRSGGGLGSTLLTDRGTSPDSKTASAAHTLLRAAGGGGMTFVPVISGLMRLFGIGKEKREEPPPLEKFALPRALRVDAGLDAQGSTFLIDRGRSDEIRRLTSPGLEDRVAPMPAMLRGDVSVLQEANGPIGVSPSSWPTRVSGNAPVPSSITVQVQAMDSQSFLDRKDDIARAVRDAMLHSHALNDVVSEV